MSRSSDFPFDIEYIVEILGLNIRRQSYDGVYVDCPFCRDSRGKMKVNYHNNIWRCNYCGASGGMLSLYSKMHNINESEAYKEICSIINNSTTEKKRITSVQKIKGNKPHETQRADNEAIHKTYKRLLEMLVLSERHKEHLKTIRGLSDSQIELLGYKSTPPFYMCKSITGKLNEEGYTIQGVPGFYQKDGYWTINFSSVTSGILIPAKGIDGMIHGFQIRLDVPLKYDDGEKIGAKYIWFSSSGKHMGTGPGSPLHFVGNPFAGVVYITEGILKADIAHCLMSRTFVAVSGISNTSRLDMLFSLLAENGTHMIIEAADMDKYRNEQVNRATSAIYLAAQKNGLSFRRLTWNPKYKGIDDWQLAIKRKKEINEERREKKELTFKKKYLYGLCDFDSLKDEVIMWQNSTIESTLPDYLGFTDREYVLYLQKRYDELNQLILSDRIKQKFRIYQLIFDEKSPTKKYAFSGISEMHKAGYEQPPASDYRLVHEGTVICDRQDDDYTILKRIANMYDDNLPDDFKGRSVSPSDIIELYNENTAVYYYVDSNKFTMVDFSPN